MDESQHSGLSRIHSNCRYIRTLAGRRAAGWRTTPWSAAWGNAQMTPQVGPEARSTEEGIEQRLAVLNFPVHWMMMSIHTVRSPSCSHCVYAGQAGSARLKTDELVDWKRCNRNLEVHSWCRPFSRAKGASFPVRVSCQEAQRLGNDLNGIGIDTVLVAFLITVSVARHDNTCLSSLCSTAT